MTLESVLKNIDAGRLMQTVDAVCTGERLSNEAEKASFAVMERLFQEAGACVHTETLRGFVSTPENASLRVNGTDYVCRTHPMTPSVMLLAAPLVYVPLRETAAVDPAAVEGAIVLTDGLAMEPVVRGLAAKGAKGVVFITGQYIHNMIVSRVWGSPTPETMHDYVTVPVVSVSMSDGERLKAEARKGSLAEMHTDVWSRWTDIPCLVAEYRHPSGQFVMVTGHNDSWHLGAMDNASGNACAIELARVFRDSQAEMKRGVRFVVWSGHSHGRYAGSTAYCDAHFEELWQHCVLNINADCLGGQCASVMTESPAMASTSELARLALKEAAGVTDWVGCRYSRSCDQSFWGPGVPSVFSQVSEQPPFEGVAAEAFKLMFGSGRSGGFGYWWHSVEDTPDKLDPELLRRDTSVFASCLWHALCDERLPLDAEAELREFTALCKAWETKAAGALDFTRLNSRLARLAERLADLFARLSAEEANDLTHRVLRELIPLSYVEGSIYFHDEALRQPPVPMLRDIDHLASADDHLRECLLVKLRREMNRLVLGIDRILLDLPA